MTELDAFGNRNDLSGIHLGTESGGVVSADADNGEGLCGEQNRRCKNDFEVHSNSSLKLYSETIQIFLESECCNKRKSP
jgi:hypothetical protein